MDPVSSLALRSTGALPTPMTHILLALPPSTQPASPAFPPASPRTSGGVGVGGGEGGGGELGDSAAALASLRAAVALVLSGAYAAHLGPAQVGGEGGGHTVWVDVVDVLSCAVAQPSIRRSQALVSQSPPANIHRTLHGFTSAPACLQPSNVSPPELTQQPHKSRSHSMPNSTVHCFRP